jgi:ATP phosphoribosyltransferase regulatory subunit
MNDTGLLPEGFHDRLPPAADGLRRFEGAVLGVAHGHGYEQVDPPLAEFEAGLVGRLKGTAATDAVRFVDPVSQRTLAIRPDITAQVARIAATRMGHHPRPVRLSYAGPVLKLRASELSPRRALRQIGAELIGLDNVAAAIEIVTVAVESLRAAGVTGISIDFTLPDLVATLAGDPPGPQHDALIAALDGKDAGRVAAIDPAYLPLVEAAGPFAAALARLRATDAAGRLASRLDAIEAVVATLPADIGVTLDPTERHGFEYQSWLGFSLFARGVLGEVGRGGSYTVCHADGQEEAAVGFSLYADALLDAGLGAKDRQRLFLPIGTSPATAARLRGEGWVTVAALVEGDTPQAQLCTHVWDGDAAQPVA